MDGPEDPGKHLAEDATLHLLLPEASQEMLQNHRGPLDCLFEAVVLMEAEEVDPHAVALSELSAALLDKALLPNKLILLLSATSDNFCKRTHYGICITGGQPVQA